MADWYVSSAAYAGLPVWQATHAYVVGDLIAPTAPALKAKHVHRCTTAGTSAGTEPGAWASTSNSTTASGTATFTNVSAQSAYGWSAAAGDVPSILSRITYGDRIFVSSDHAETQTTTTYYSFGVGSYLLTRYLSVDRGGSVPPVAADLLAGATLTVSGASNLSLDNAHLEYWYGFNFVMTGSGNIILGSTAFAILYLRNCQLYLNNSNATTLTSTSTNCMSAVVFDNTTVRFGATTQRIFAGGNNGLKLRWINTPSPLAGSIFPATLFVATSSGTTLQVTCRGLDLSAVTGILAGNGAALAGVKILLESCKIAAAATRYSTTSITNTRDFVELVNCYDGTNVINEVYQPAGSVVDERTITLTGGARDAAGVAMALKMVSTANVDTLNAPLMGWFLDVENTLTGSSRTATVELISSGTLNNDECWLQLLYEGTAGSSLVSFADSAPATRLTAASAVPTSSATWASAPATPVKQYLQVTFTPQTAGRVRGRVMLGRASTTIYVDPRLVIT